MFYPDLKRRSELCAVNAHEWMEERTDTNRAILPDDKWIDLMLRFVVYFCERDSPAYMETDYDRRVRVAISLSKVPPKSLLGQMITSRHWWFRRMLLAYMSMYSPQRFEQWLAYKAMRQNMLNNIMILSEDKDMIKAQIASHTAIEEVNEKILILEKQLFALDEVAEDVSHQVAWDAEYTAEFYAQDFQTFK